MKSFPGSASAILAFALALVSCAGSDSGSAASGGGNTNQDSGGTGNATSGGDTGVGGNGAGGVQSNGGTPNSGGVNATGGMPNAGGSINTGGAQGVGGSKASGGAIATGGSKATGGNVATGGGIASGGNSTSGGTKAGGGTSTANGGVSTGGTKASGGTIATGGAIANGGSPATGGTKTTGGTPSTGGMAVTGGTKATGGMVATGGMIATGGRATGGASSSAGACTYTGSGSLTASSGELTCYYFGQGSAKGECMGSNTFKTNCGYCGTEGSATGNACNSGHNDAVANISTGAYYVAVPNWGAGASCGLCLSVSYNGKTITATVVDNCASCGSGHIDLSPAAGAALGMGTGAGQTEDPTSGVSWKTVSCPVGTSSIVAVYNGTYAGQIYFQNVAFPIASASAVVGGTTHTANLTNGMWDFGITLTPGTQITLKDIAGHTVTGTFGSNGGSLGVQFPTTC